MKSKRFLLLYSTVEAEDSELPLLFDVVLLVLVLLDVLVPIVWELELLSPLVSASEFDQPSFFPAVSLFGFNGLKEPFEVTLSLLPPLLPSV